MLEGLTLRERDEILARLGQAFEVSAAEALVDVLDRVVAWRAEMVTRQDFQELQKLMGQMLEGQRVLQDAVARLTEAQARTEERMGRLEEAQIRTEERMGRLEEAQIHTEERMGRLEEALARLAEAQTETQRELRQLSRQVGGLSDRMGGEIEDRAYRVLPRVLKRELGWDVGDLERAWQYWNGEAEEVNIFGQARDPAQPDRAIWIVGEAKHNLTINQVNRFAKQVGRARQHLKGDVFPVCFCYRARPDVQARAQELGIRLIFSYGRMI
jgi:predicted nuclease with TOPRIM domain